MKDTQKQPASVPAELIEQWYIESCKLFGKAARDKKSEQHIANRAAAYGREQSGVLISHDAWAELVARHPETMQVLFGGQS